MNTYYVYIITNFKNSVLYIGVTNDIERRIYEHKSGKFEGFTKRYNLNKLVYFETYTDIKEAIYREKHLKGKKRDYKNLLIEKTNPQWKDIIIKK